MKSTYKKILFIISVIALSSVIVGVIKYSLNYIENNPELYLPSQKAKKFEYKFTSKNIKTVLNMFYIDRFSNEKNKFLTY